MATSARAAARRGSGRARNLINNFTTPGPPAESVRRPGEIHHQKPIFAGHAGRTSDNGDGVADLQGFLSNTTITQLRRAGPFHGPSLDGAGRVLSLEGDEGMRISERKLDQLAFELDLLTHIVGCSIRMMSVGRCSRQNNGGDAEQKYSAHHYFFSLRLL